MVGSPGGGAACVTAIERRHLATARVMTSDAGGQAARDVTRGGGGRLARGVMDEMGVRGWQGGAEKLCCPCAARLDLGHFSPAA